MADSPAHSGLVRLQTGWIQEPVGHREKGLS